MDAQVYNQKGEAVGKIKIPESIFGVRWNSDLVHQVVTSMLSSKRKGTAHAKTRGEVRGGGKKPWKQKGTGRARHGSSRSPIWVGGGVTHGPRNEKNYFRKVNKKMKTKALLTVLSRKFRDGEVAFVDEISLKEPKTKLAIRTLVSLSKIPALKNVLRQENALWIFFPEKTPALARAFRNVNNISIDETRNMNPVSLLAKKKILMVYPEEAFRILSSRFAKEEGAAPLVTETKKKTRAIKKEKITAK